MNRRVIYFVYLLILVSAVFYRTVRADSSATLEWQVIEEPATIERVELLKQDQGTDVVIGLNQKVKPRTYFLSKENSIVLDFDDVLVAEELAEAFSNDDLKLGYIINGGNKTRVKLFIRAKNKMKLLYDENNVVVRLRSWKEASRKTEAKKENRLVNPSDRKYSQAVLSFNNSDFEVVVKKLASEAEIELDLGGGLPQSISANFETSTPFEALRSIACENDLKFYNTGKAWYMSGV